MDAASDFQEFSVSDLVTVRLLQLYTYARDLDASDDADRWLVEHAHEHNISDADELLAAPAKRACLHELVTSTVGWAKQLDLPAHLAGVADLGLTTNLAEDVKALLRVQAGLVGHAVTRAVLLEADDRDWLAQRQFVDRESVRDRGGGSPMDGTDRHRRRSRGAVSGP